MFISVPDSTGVLIRKDHNKWRGSQQIGSPEPGNERGSLQKHYSFKAKIPDEKARKGFGIRDEICKTGLKGQEWLK